VSFPTSFIKSPLRRVSDFQYKIQDAVGKEKNVKEHNFTRQNTLFWFTVQKYIANRKEEFASLSVLPTLKKSILSSVKTHCTIII